MATRGNDCTNPFLKTGSSGWFTTGGVRITTATGLDAVAGDSAGRTTAWEAPAGGGSVVLPNVNGAELGGQHRHHSVYAKASDAGTTATLNLQSYYDDGSAATFRGGHDGTPVALTAGQWVRIGHAATLRAADEPNPGDPAANQCRTVITTTGTGTIQFSLALFEGEASLALVADPPGSYFDGDSTGGAWTGTNGNSSSTLAVEDEAAVIHGWGDSLPSSDDFTTYTGVPEPTKWDLYDGPGHAGNGLRDPAQNTVADGFLRIHGLTNGTTGALRHVLDQQYGRWEVRLRLLAAPAATGDAYHGVAIIWPTSEAWPEDGEYDFFETLVDQDRPEAWLHYPHPEGPTQQEHAVFAQPLDITQWHNYALEWTPNGLVGYVDGVEWFSYSGGAGPGGRSDIQDMASGHLTLQLDAFVATPTLQEAYLDVEWARVYEYELDSVVVQASPVTFSGAAATTISATLPAAAAAGNALALIIAGDKDLQPLGADAPVIAGFAQTVFLHTGNVSLIIAWREAAGGETTISATIDADADLNLSGADAFVVELWQAGDGVWEVKGSATAADDGSDITVKSAGTTGPLTGDGLALAAWAVDSINTKGTADYSDGYVELANPSGGAPGGAGLWVATKPVTGGTTTTATLTRVGAAIDEMCGAIVVLGRAVDSEAAQVTHTTTASITATATTSTDADAAVTATVTASTSVMANVASPGSVTHVTTAGSTVTGNVNSPAKLAATITAALEAFAEAALPEITLGGALPHVSFWVVDPATGALTPLPHVMSFNLSQIRNAFGSVRVTYPRGGKNYELLRAIVDDDVQLEVEIWVGGSPVGRMRALLMEAEGDDATDASEWTFAGHFLEYRMRDAVVAPNPEPGADWKTYFDNETPGTVVATLMLAAQARGTLTDVGFGSFTAEFDSNGVAWSQAVNMEFAPHRSYDEVLTDLVDAGVLEWEVTPDHELRLYEPGSRGTDRTVPVGDFTGGLYPSGDLYPSDELFPAAPVPSGEPLILRAGRGMREARRKYSNRDAGTDLWVAGGEGLYDSAHDATARARYGRQIERTDSQNYILDDGALDAYIQNKIGAITAGALELTVGIEFGAGKPQPVAGFNVGDWIYIDAGRSHIDHAPLERYRVAQWSLDGDGDELTGTVSVNDLMAERISRLEKLIRGVAGGAVVVGTSLPEQDTKPPAAPTGVSASSLAYLDDEGKGYAAVTVSWNNVTTNADGTALFDMSGYRIRYRYVSGGPDGFFDAGRVSSLYTTHTFSQVLSGSVVAVSVQAYDRTELESEWSSEFTFVAAADAAAPPVPSTPTVTNYIGLLRVDWDGLGSVGENQPVDFDRVEILASEVDDFDPATDPYTLIGELRGEGQRVWSPPGSLGNVDYDTTWYAKLRAVDNSGNVSATSGQGSAIPGRVEEGDVASVNVGVLTSGISNAVIVNAGIIRSAESGARYELDDASLRFLDEDENVTFEGGGPSGAVTMRGTLAAGASFVSGDRIVIDPDYVQPGGAEFPTITLYSASGAFGPARINATSQAGNTTALGLNSGPTTTTATYEQSTLFLWPQAVFLSVNAGSGGVTELNRRGGGVVLTKSEATMVYAPNGIDRSYVQARADGAQVVGQSLAGSEQSHVWAGSNGNVEVSAAGEVFIEAAGSSQLLMTAEGANVSLRVDSNNRVSLTTSGSQLISNGVVKSFVIPHPADPDRWLVHGCTESPVAGVEYWGQAIIENNEATVTLPPYFEALALEEGRSVVLTPELAEHEGMPMVLNAAPTPIVDGRFRIVCPAPDGSAVHWLVKAARRDASGFEVEPLRSDVQVHGDGPYRYLTPITQEESAA